MKKTSFLVLTALLILGLFVTVAFANTPNQEQPKNPKKIIASSEGQSKSSKEVTTPKEGRKINEADFEEMWDYCQSRNGMMNYYNGDNNGRENGLRRGPCW